MEASVDGDASEIDTLLLAIASYLAEVLFWTQRQLQVSGSAVAVDGMYLQSLCQVLATTALHYTGARVLIPCFVDLVEIRVLCRQG